MKTLSQHPCREVRTLEQRVFQDTFDASQRLDHVRPVVVQVPELAVVSLMGPPACVSRDAVRIHSTSKTKTSSRGDEYKGRRRAPERVLPEHLILLEVRPAPPALRGTYTIAKPPRLARATRSPSDDHDDGVEVVSRRRHRPDVKFKFIFCPESDLVVGERVPIFLK